MTKFTEGFEKLSSDFRARGIPTDHPGFCDHPNFLAAEKKDHSFLNNYAAFIATQPYSAEYLQRARSVISKASNILFDELKSNGRLGACVDISGIFSRILEKEGIWSCGIKGSLTITFPTESKEEKAYFWPIAKGDFVAGHAWLYAPPFSIVDVAIKQQPYTGNQVRYLPDINLIESASSTKVEIEDIVSPYAIANLKLMGLPRDQYLSVLAPELDDILHVFPAQVVNGEQGVEMKYCPTAIHLPDASLEGMRNMDFQGKTPFQLYEEKFVGRL